MAYYGSLQIPFILAQAETCLWLTVTVGSLTIIQCQGRKRGTPRSSGREGRGSKRLEPLECQPPGQTVVSWQQAGRGAWASGVGWGRCTGEAHGWGL